MRHCNCLVISVMLLSLILMALAGAARPAQAEEAPAPPLLAPPAMPSDPTEPLGAPDVLPYPIDPPDSAVAADAARFGVDATGDISLYDVGQLNIGWYMNWGVAVNPSRPDGIEFAQTIRLLDGSTTDFWPPDWNTIAQAIAANPGAIWFIGNEPDHRGQDNCTAAQYAERYHQCYTFIKQRDATARVAAGGLVQVTPLRLHWLNDVLAAYQSAYGTTLPADAWHTHIQILCETCGWGATYPPGMAAYQQSEGRYYTTADAADVTILQQMVADLRAWMRDQGYRALPLYISEYGVLQPSGCGYLGGSNADRGDQMVTDFMLASFDWLLDTTNAETGCPSDGNHLVQKWAWYSLDARMSSRDCSYITSANGSLYNWEDTSALTSFGLTFKQYTHSLGLDVPCLPPEQWILNYGVKAGGWTNFDAYPRCMGDVNGDGKADVVGFGNKGVYVSLSTGSAFGRATQWISNYGVLAGKWTTYDAYPRCVADVNGDGKADVVGFGNKGVYVSLSNGSSFQAGALWIANFGMAAGQWTSQDLYPRLLGDVNGDGRADIVAFGKKNVYISLSTGHAFSAPTTSLATFCASAGGWTSYDTYPRALGDVNGDGRADIVGFGNKAVYVSLSTGSGYAAPKIWAAAFGKSAGGWDSQDHVPRVVGDVNGDGMADIVGFYTTGAQVSRSTGSAFPVPAQWIANYGANAGGWSSQSVYPRTLGDVNGDNQADIVGFGNKATYVSRANE